MKGCALLNDNLKDPETTASIVPDGSAFKRAHGLNLFQYLATVSSHFIQYKIDRYRYIYVAGTTGTKCRKLNCFKVSCVVCLFPQRYERGMVGFGQVTGKAMLPKGFFEVSF
jgi:hypothetical protein